MDKNILKSFAIEARRNMIETVKYQANLIGISENGINEPISKADGMETYNYGAGTYSIFNEDIKKRDNLVKEINNREFNNVIEEIAYTWFNRIIAIRFMEVNDYLPTRTRVLSSEIKGKTEPDIVTDALELDLDYSINDKELIFKLKDENKLDELFRFLFIKQCNKLNEILPGLFEKTDDYMELLLKISFIDEESVISKLINIIPEEDFTQVEIIGWMYQYYNSELKDKYNKAIGSKPIQKDQIPAVTQLFTPDWIVQYLTDNSLGRYWIERNKNSKLKENLNFYFEEPEQNTEVQTICEKIRNEPVQIESLKFFDPCMGSGHILVYAFEIFMKIYTELGYIEKEIPELILKNNLYGLDIDKRAYQLAYFALMMKGRQYDRKLLNKKITPNVFPIIDSNISRNTMDIIRDFNREFASDMDYLCDVFKNGREFGSLIKIKKLDFDLIESNCLELINNKNKNLSDINLSHELKNNVLPLIKQAKLLSSKYEIVVTNPPYLNKYNPAMKDFCKKNYKDYSRDLFSIFIYRNFDFCKIGGYTAFMTPLGWMYLKSFEKLRKFIINNKYFVSLIEMGFSTLREIGVSVSVCSFILGNYNFESEYNGTFLKLSDFTGVNVQKEKTLSALKEDVDYKFFKSPKTFCNLPSYPIAYWAETKLSNIFNDNTNLKSYAEIKKGISTGDNDLFLRRWYEIEITKSSLFSKYDSSLCKWVPHNKGGKFRKWYGNRDYVINWQNNGQEIKKSKKAGLRLNNPDFYFNESISWSNVGSDISFRYYSDDFIFDNTGSSIFLDDKLYWNYIFGFLNSSISQDMLNILASTLDYNVGQISLLPVIIDNSKLDEVNDLVLENIELTRSDYDDYETSWNFKKHPLIRDIDSDLSTNYERWSVYKNKQFDSLKNNEIRLNRIFSEIYDLETDVEVKDKFISITRADYESDIKSFISYAVGCMFGRYTQDKEGLIFAGGKFNINDYSSFVPDDDNIIPVLDTEYFDDDIVGRFVEFVKICFGEESLEENLEFIAETLNKKGKTSREIIRKYFISDFFKDHARIYNKRPIYWMFSSGKQNAFNCLIYMHRYEPNTVARIRVDYLHKTQKAIEQNIIYCENIITKSSNKTEISKAIKDKNRFVKQLDEIKAYDEALGHMANQHIEIDLDDGVKVNYAKFQKIEISQEGEKTKKINLLKNI